MPDHTVCFSEACMPRAPRRRPTRAAPASKEEQLARLMLEVGVEASASILERVRSRVGAKGVVSPPPSAAPPADPRQAGLCVACPEYYCGCPECMRRFGAELAAYDRG